MHAERAWRVAGRDGDVSGVPTKQLPRRGRRLWYELVAAMATTATDIRDGFLTTLGHVDSAFGKLNANAGPGRPLTFPDLHKTSEGLFLSAWTHWEQFLRELFIIELATDPNGKLRKEVKAAGFRLKRSHLRLATLLADHPDEGKWVEWSSIDVVQDRADVLLAAGHRFSSLTPAQLTDIRRLKKIRNAVAHKSDKAWDDFRALVQAAPYTLTARSMKGLTTGRFLAAHTVGADRVFTHSVQVVRDAARTLVP